MPRAMMESYQLSLPSTTMTAASMRQISFAASATVETLQTATTFCFATMVRVVEHIIK